ncbi:hypothetical protein [Blastomonas sp. CCH2-A2]|uniref:hypothetical protein n=1 Tax=Blastomonas sp. CCH2-A2 TaxID=1768788 RepID=UPI0008249AF4|nr:hypothetical protein [Blastomonas sp. CCH2-A2]
MATAPITEEQPAANDADTPDLIAIVEQDRGAVLTGKVDPDAYVAALRASIEAKGLTPDTRTGLDQIKSEAHSIRGIKAGIDRTRKQLTEHWRQQTAKVNEAGKVITEKLDALIEEVRAPVTKWEEAEKARKAEADRIIATLEAAKLIRFGETSETVQARLEEIRGMNLNDEVLGPRLEMAEDLKAEVVAELAKAATDLAAQEAQAAELERLRREKAEADARAEQAEAQRIAEQQRQERERAEQERIAKAAEEAAEAERRKAQEAAEQADRERQQAAQLLEDRRNYARQVVDHIKMVGLGMIGGQTYPYPILIRELEEKIAIDDSLGDMQDDVRAIRDLTLQNVKDAFERHLEREKLAEAERQREAEQRAREEAEAAAAEAQRQREADLAHRQQVIDAAVDALAGDSGIPGLTRKLATSIIHAIEAGKVPAVSIKF